MDFTFLNPIVRSAAIWERQSKNEERVGYDSRIIYVISGDITATVDGRKLGHLSPGHLLYIPAGLPYKLRVQYSRLAVLSFDLTADHPEPKDRIPPARPEDFKAELCHMTVDSAPFDKAIHIEDMESERDNLIQMCNIFTSGEGNYLAEISAMVKLLLLKISDAVDEHALPGQMVNSLDAYIRENVGEEISNTEIGAIFGYHPFYVSKILKDRKGITLRQYIIAYRLKAAKRLLEHTDRSINEIADETGFTDASYFTKTFKATFGMTPKEYRNRFKDELI